MNLSYTTQWRHKKLSQIRLMRIGIVGLLFFLFIFWYSALHPTEAQSPVEQTQTTVSGSFGQPFTGKELEPTEIIHTVSPTPTATVTPTPTAQPTAKVESAVDNSKATIDSIYRHTQSYKGLYTKELLNKILNECGSIHNVRVAVALSVPESSQGRNSQFGFNWWNYDRYNKTYQTDQNAVIKAVCIGLNGRYKNLIDSNGKVNVELGKRYNATYTEDWKNNIEWSFKKTGLNYE